MGGWVGPIGGMNGRLSGPHGRYECCEETNPCLRWESKFVSSVVNTAKSTYPVRNIYMTTIIIIIIIIIYIFYCFGSHHYLNINLGSN
jgi:uncharacterized membrane protein YvbJ